MKWDNWIKISLQNIGNNLFNHQFLNLFPTTPDLKAVILISEMPVAKIFDNRGGIENQSGWFLFIYVPQFAVSTSHNTIPFQIVVQHGFLFPPLSLFPVHKYGLRA